MSESASSSSSSAGPSSRPPWRRILYEQQPYPDNYTPPGFLAGYLPSSQGGSTGCSSSAPSLSYRTLLFLTLIIMSRLSILLLFLSLFYAISTSVLSSSSLLSINLGIIALLLSIHLLLAPRTRPASSFPASLPPPQSSSSSSSFASLCLLFFLLYLASPLLSSLTLAYSDDTIYMLTALMSILHLLTFDYQHINYPTASPSSPSSSSSSSPAPAAALPLASLDHTVSLNCALFLSILLASRLTSHQQTFLLLLSSSLLFAVSPAQQQLLRHRSPVLHLLSSLSLMLGCSLVFLCLRLAVVLVCYLLCCCFVVLLCPGWMLWLQRDKQEIRGPWDYDDEPENRSENL